MENFLLKQVISPMMVLALSVGAIVLQPQSVHAATFSATEDVYSVGGWGETLTFTVTTDYTDIVEFAIGNSQIGNAWIDDTFSNPTSGDFYGAVATKSLSGQWTTKIWSDDGNGVESFVVRDLDWMEDENSGFADEDEAFLFTSYNDEIDVFDGYLTTGLTNGYMGSTMAGLHSRVAALSSTGDIINGGEASVVPIPAAVWLFGSGLIGLAFRSRKGKA